MIQKVEEYIEDKLRATSHDFDRVFEQKSIYINSSMISNAHQSYVSITKCAQIIEDGTSHFTDSKSSYINGGKTFANVILKFMKDLENKIKSDEENFLASDEAKMILEGMKLMNETFGKDMPQVTKMKSECEKYCKS